MLRLLRIFGLLVSLFGAMLIGCGGGGGHATTFSGKVMVHISWPGRGRYIPPYANSIVCSLKAKDGAVYPLTVNRPSNEALDGTVAFPQSFPEGVYPVTVSAYPEANGQGQVIASANVYATVQKGSQAQIDVSADLQSTIERVVIEGQPLTVQVGQSISLRGHAVDGSGHTLLLPDNSLTWNANSCASIGTFDTSTGRFTATATGKATVSLSESGANKNAEAEITVTESTTPAPVIVQIDWPGRSRYVPPYANSISCKLEGGNLDSDSMIVNRSGDSPSQSSVRFPNTFDPGNYTLTVNAYDQADATGQLVATAKINIVVRSGESRVVNVSADLCSTIDHVVIHNQPLSIVMPGKLNLVGHAEDATNQVILLPEGTLKWDVVLGQDKGSVDASTGVFTPIATGTATVRLRETGAGKSAQSEILIQPPTSGSLTISVDWPGRSRYVPPYANSVECILTISGSEQYRIVINRYGDGASTGTGTFPQQVQPGTYTLTSTAYAQVDAIGSVVARATNSVKIEVGKTTTQNISADFDTVIDHIVIDGDPITARTGYDQYITGHAEDAAHNVLLLPVGALTWDVGAYGAYGSIHPVTGLFTPYFPGTAYVRLKEAGAGKYYTARVTISVGITPKFYFADNQNNRIIRTTTITGTSWKSFTHANTCSCDHQVAVDSRNGVYWPCSDSKLHYIANFDSPVETTMGMLGSGYGCFNNPKGIAIDRLNRIYIVDSGNNRIIRMNDISGAGWTEVGRFGNGDGELNNPVGITVSPDFEIFVCDTGNHRIVRIFDMASSGWDYLGSYGTGFFQFSSPKGICFYRTGLFICDTGNNRIVNVTDIRGSGWTTFGTLGTGTNQFNGPTGISCDLSGYFYVNDTNNYRAVRFTSMTGTNWTTFGTQGSGTNQFGKAYGICLK